jgi:hypothetical protein
MDWRFSGGGARRNLLDGSSYRSTRMKSWDTKYLKVSYFGLKPVQADGSADEA